MSQDAVVNTETWDPKPEVAPPDDAQKLHGTTPTDATGTLSKFSNATSTTDEKTVSGSASAGAPDSAPVKIEMSTNLAAVKIETQTTTSFSGSVEGEQGQTLRKSMDIPTHERLNKIEKRLVFISLCMGMFLSALDQMIVIVCLPKIVSDLGGAQYLTWVLSAYLLTSSATMPLYGKFSDIYGRRPSYLISLFFFLAGSLACGFARTIWELIGFRGLQGVGGGGLMSLSSILIGDIVKPASRAKYMSSMSGIFGVATIVGPVLGGFFTDYISWRWIFFINLPFGVVTFVVCWFVLKKIQNAQKDMAVDVIGSCLVFIGTVCVVLFVTWGGDNYAWGSWEILVLIFASVLLFSLFIMEEMRHPEPIIDLKMFKIWNFAVTCLIMVFFGIAMFGGFTFLPIYFQNIRGDSAIISGLKLVPMVMGMMFASIGTGFYVSKTGKFMLFPKVGMGLLALGEGLLALMNETMSYGVEWIFMFIMGVGMGMCFPVFNGLVQNSVPEKAMASSVAGVTFVRSISGSIGVAIFGSILTQQTTYHLKHGDKPIPAELKALQTVFLCSMAPALVGLIITFFIKASDIFTRKPNSSAPPPVME